MNDASSTGDKFTAGVVKTGVVDTCGNFARVSLIPVVHLDLRVNFWKIQNDPNIIFRSLGEDDS
jgi:hypothetical protein